MTALAASGWGIVVALVLVARRSRQRARLPVAAPPSRAAAWIRSWSAILGRPRVADDLPEILDVLARGLRTGLSLRQALAALPEKGALAGPTRRLHHDLELGRPIGEAVAAWVERLDDPLSDLAGAALGLVVAAGGTGADAVDRVAATVRDRRAVELEMQAQASQAQASALVIGLLPVGFFVLAVGADPDTADFLFGSPVGLGCLVAGFALDAGALWWMHRITTVVRW